MDTLSIQSYLQLVLEHHPLIKKAALYDEVEAGYLLKGKGVLDPKMGSDYQTKYFDQKDYFTIWQTEAKIPTALPIDFSVGYEQNDGLFLNEQNSVPANGLIYGSINISLLRGLLFNEQRYQIQEASLYGIKSQLEKDIIIREVLYQAVLVYLEWSISTNQLSINETYSTMIRERHSNVIALYENGDIPAIDTTESRLNLNTANKRVLNSQDKQIQKQLKLSLFIWDEEGNPLQLVNGLIPSTPDNLIEELGEIAMIFNPNFETDPYIQKIDNEIVLLQLQNRLEKELLKPKLNLKYNTIMNLGQESINPTMSLRDYKYAVSFEYPILNRKSKGEIKLNQALISQSEMTRIEKIGNIGNKYEGLLKRLNLQTELLTLSQDKIANSELLYDAEQLKFSIGESSIFLLNQRESKLIEARMEQTKNFESIGNILIDLYYFKLGQS